MGAVLQQPVTIVFMPIWIHTAMKRNRSTLSNVLRYSAIEKGISRDDMVSFIAFDQYCVNFLKGAEESLRLLSLWEANPLETDPSAKKSLATLRQAITDVYSRRSNIEQDALTRLNVVSGTAAAQDAAPYSVIAVDNDKIIFVADYGFNLEKISANPKDYYVMIRKLLETLYVYHSSEIVAQTPVFQTYLTLLSEGTNP